MNADLRFEEDYSISGLDGPVPDCRSQGAFVCSNLRSPGFSFGGSSRMLMSRLKAPTDNVK